MNLNENYNHLKQKKTNQVKLKITKEKLKHYELIFIFIAKHMWSIIKLTHKHNSIVESDWPKRIAEENIITIVYRHIKSNCYTTLSM